MKEEMILKLLQSTVYEDVLLGIEYMGKNISRENFDKSMSKRGINNFKYMIMYCCPPKDVIIVWEGVYYVWDGNEIWDAGKDDAILLPNDVIINL